MKPLLLLAAAAAIACSGTVHEDAGAPQGSAPATAAGAPIEDRLADLGVLNGRVPQDGLIAAGQITPDQMTALRDLGYHTFINLRPQDEPGTGWEEEATAEQGVHYVRIPIAGADGINPDNARTLAQHLPADGTGKAVIYCASGNRVGALLALKAHVVDGRPAQQALDFGLAAGLTRLEPAVRDRLGLPPGDP